ncbi:MAG: UDP-N-acetylmuramate--L-alanine ligase [Candidatus Nanopelagicaceae bacterium]
MIWRGLRVHFIGIGGSGMSGIAKVMAARGALVSGSDIQDSGTLEALRAFGITVFVGHDPANIGEAELVVTSSAIGSSNPELAAAMSSGKTILGRAEALSRLLIGKRSIAVAGTHGKTTTTSMLTVALQSCGLDPSFAIGASIRNSGTNAHDGSGDIFVVEADESDGSFTSYNPYGAIITNIELDHVDNFKDLASIDSLFDQFLETISSQLVLCNDDLGVKRLLERSRGALKSLEVTTYGTGGDPDLHLDRIFLGPRESKARLVLRGRVLGELNLAIPGAHNLLNAAAAIAMGEQLGAPIAQLLSGLSNFSGARRRFEIRGSTNGVTVIDDYGHHPTEIRATLDTARNFAGSGKVLVVFQPHRFSRTRAFAGEFAEALQKADHTYLLEVYPAGEKALPGVSSLSISAKMPKELVTYEPSMLEVISKIVKAASPGDVIITLGAGDVSSLAPLIVENL